MIGSTYIVSSKCYLLLDTFSQNRFSMVVADEEKQPTTIADLPSSCTHYISYDSSLLLPLLSSPSRPPTTIIVNTIDLLSSTSSFLSSHNIPHTSISPQPLDSRYSPTTISTLHDIVYNHVDLLVVHSSISKYYLMSPLTILTECPLSYDAYSSMIHKIRRRVGRHV